ncbi:hypothetical protein EFP18_26800 [Burkholderia glumae]|nr:hypothetical protein EFP18_26800 [Burkholderia glumae]
MSCQGAPAASRLRARPRGSEDEGRGAVREPGAAAPPAGESNRIWPARADSDEPRSCQSRRRQAAGKTR